jgi:glutamate N-acetyltransferase/amino-acid N-acetyltransferase
MRTYPIRQGIPGFKFSAVLAGIKKNTGLDLGLIVSDQPCAVAGVFTRNRVKAAPVIECMKKVRHGVAQAIVVNSGNANACTGKPGLHAAELTCSALAAQLGIQKKHTLPCSTGVIGVPLPHDKIIAALPRLIAAASPKHSINFAESIITTDTCTKTIALREKINGHDVHICGIAKGSGMIMPDMATMLAFIITDAAIDACLLQTLLREENELSFNRICVDGDMSTNDSVLIMAGGKSGVAIKRNTPQYTLFRAMLRKVMQELALMIVQDGEGATKLLRINVQGARTESDAKKAAMQVARSCLVKTAFFGEDFNWGRIIAAVGQSGAACRTENISIHFDGILAVSDAQAVPKNKKRLERTMKKKEITISINLGSGSKTCDVLTCDLSYDYVKINADYTT